MDFSVRRGFCFVAPDASASEADTYGHCIDRIHEVRYYSIVELLTQVPPFSDDHTTVHAR